MHIIKYVYNHKVLGQLRLRLSQNLAGDPKRKGWSPAKMGCVSLCIQKLELK